MLTLFTTTKPFRGRDAANQRNAILSWLQLRPHCEIILFGNEEGSADVAKEFGLRHIPDMACNEYGTPLLNAMFETAQQLSNRSLLCYINADIILLSDFISAVRRIPFRRFLMIGQRWDVDISQPLDINYAGWENQLRQYVQSRGVLHPYTGIDYFVFPRQLWDDIPPFAIGRFTWDNWLVYESRMHKAAVIDATPVVMAVHQNHDIKLSIEGGPEAKHNLNLAGGYEHAYTLHDATWMLMPRMLVPAVSKRHILRRWQLMQAKLTSFWCETR